MNVSPGQSTFGSNFFGPRNADKPYKCRSEHMQTPFREPQLAVLEIVTATPFWQWPMSHHGSYSPRNGSHHQGNGSNTPLFGSDLAANHLLPHCPPPLRGGSGSGSPIWKSVTHLSQPSQESR